MVGLSLLPAEQPVVNIVVSRKFRMLGGTGGNGTLEVAVVDAVGEGTHESRQFGSRTKNAPRVIGTWVGGEGRACACGKSEILKILPATSTDVEGVRVLFDDGEESKLGAEPHDGSIGGIDICRFVQSRYYNPRYLRRRATLARGLSLSSVPSWSANRAM